VHQIAGVEMRKLHSFPSGHATTAFTMALIMAHMSNKKFWSIMLPILAALAAYSRVYLSQHFPTDVLAGMCIGILSAILSLLIYRSFNKYTAKQAALKQGTISSA
jgi:membrane-associated phospholipid phosphatase